MAETTSTFTRASVPAPYERVMVPAVFGPWAKDLFYTLRCLRAPGCWT